MKPFLKVKNLRKSFQSSPAVDIEHLEIRKGEIISILGPSGCGKTTFLRLLAGFERPDSGEILLHGQSIGNLEPHERQINTVFQNYALFPHLNVFENIAFGLRIKNLKEEEIQKSVLNALRMIQMENYAASYPGQISGGQKQRVAIARALVLKPDILLLDEPLAALDLKLRQRMLLELELIHDEVGITFIFITHDQHEAMSISDRIAVMNKGRIEQIGTPREIYEAPCNNFVAAFIGDSNFFEGTVLKSSENDSKYATISIEGLASVKSYRSKNMDLSEHVYLGLRPEKIHIFKSSSNHPDEIGSRLNVLEGVVEDIIYLGSQTKYWVRVGPKRLIVLQQHDHFLSKDQTITWNDKVWITWDADDSFILDRFIDTTDSQDELDLKAPESESLGKDL